VPPQRASEFASDPRRGFPARRVYGTNARFFEFRDQKKWQISVCTGCIRCYNLPTKGPMVDESSADVTQLLQQWSVGDTDALRSLMPLVYDELHRLARRSLSGEHAGHTLQTTALVHEAYLRMIQQDETNWKNRAHFYAIAAQLMRRILIDHGRAARTDKRRVMMGAIPLDDAYPRAVRPQMDFLELHEALEELESFDAQKARVVELRFFGGLSIEEAAEVLGISTSTVKREWNVARAWLARKLKGTGV
jgi:RNA polymerase sigma factor (TIGR02999 family)